MEVVYKPRKKLPPKPKPVDKPKEKIPEKVNVIRANRTLRGVRK